MWRYFAFILSAALVGCAAADAGQIQKQAGNILVRVPETAPASGVPRVEIQRAGEPAVTIELNNRTALVEDVKFAGPNSIVIHGRTRLHYPRTATITVIDAGSKKIVDTIWALDASFSPDGRFVTYFYRAGHSSGQVVLRPALVAYDLTAPAWNAVWAAAPEHPGDPFFYDRGVVLYPERHRQARRYLIVLSLEEGQTSSGRDRNHFISPIAWSPDSKRIAVVEGYEDITRLVVIDISQGLLKPTITTATVPREPFIEPYYASKMEEYPGAWVFVKELRFTEDGGSVVLTSQSSGPYGEKTIILPIPVAAEPR